MAKKLSIKDISALSGVSTATVSRVINGTGRYSKETEERVQAVIREHHYVPNLVAKGLRTHRMHTVGIVVPDITNEFFVKLVYELESALFAHRYASFICNTNEDPDRERQSLQMLQMQGVSGVVYISGGYHGDYRELTDIPTVFIDRTPDPACVLERSVRVESDNRQGGYLATEELLAKGCRRIAMLTDRRRLSSQMKRIEGYQAAHWDYRVPCDPRYILDLDRVDFQDAYARVSALVDEGLPFDGIFASTDWLAMGAYAALAHRQIAVPDSVKLVGFDDIPLAEFHALPLTTIHQQVDQMSQAAVDSLLRMIQHQPVEEPEQVIPVYLVRRQSTG